MIKIIQKNDAVKLLLKKERQKIHFERIRTYRFFNYKFFFFLIILIFFKIYFKKLKIIDNIKICLCTIGKNENKYVREYVDHYIKYGVDKIFIYDNNDLNGESFEDIIRDYIKNKNVEIINYRGKKTMQVNMMRDCYKKNNKKYDWFIMYDMDEFIFLKNYNNIKFYLNNKRFKECTLIYLNRPFHTDNEQIHYNNKSLVERFPKAFYNIKSIKSILRGHNPNINILSIHGINYRIPACNGFGQKGKKKKVDFKYYYINHYYFKSTEEFVKKINRGDAFYLNNDVLKMNKIKFYFAFNKISLKKINYIEKETRIKQNNELKMN